MELLIREAKSLTVPQGISVAACFCRAAEPRLWALLLMQGRCQ